MPITSLKYTSILQIPATKLLGNTSGATAAAAAIGLGTGLAFSGGNLTLSGIANASLANSSLTVTAGSGLSGGGAVSLGSSTTLSLATSSAYSILGNATGSAAVPSALSSGIALGTPGYVAGGTNILQATATANSYVQVSVQNGSSGSSASSDLVVTADNGNDTTHYADFGINGSGGGAAPFTGANAAYLYSVDNELDIAATGASGQVKFYTTGGTSPVLAGYFDATQKLNLTNALTVPNGGTGLSSTTSYAVICGGTTSTGALQAVSGLGTSGYVLTSNGAGALPTWQAATGGGVSLSVANTWTAKQTFAQTTGTTTNCLQATGIASQSVASYKSVLGSSQTGAHLETYNSDGTTLTCAISSGGKLTTYNGVTTAGYGVPTIVAAARVTGQTATNASIASFTPSADGDYLISWNMTITAFTSQTSFVPQVTFKDEGGTTRTYTMGYMTTSGGVAASFGSATTFAGIPIRIRAQSGTAIVVKTTGTLSLTYNMSAEISQLQ